MSDRFDLLLVQIKSSVVCALVPFNRAEVGDLVTCDDGIGMVIKKVDFLEKDGEFVQFVQEIIPVYEAVSVYNRGYVKGEEKNGN
jgi:hypothetical protein